MTLFILPMIQKESEVIHNLIKMRKVDYALLAKMEVSREFRKQQNLNLS